MKTSVTFFIVGAVFLIAALIIGYIYIPKLDVQNGTKSVEDVTLSLPVSEIDFRYLNGGIVPFGYDDDTSMIFEVKDGGYVYAVADGTVTDVSDGKLVIKPIYSVDITYTNVTDVSVGKGEYVYVGDRLGVVDGDYLGFSVENVNDDIFECPYLYFNADAQGSIDDAFKDADLYDEGICVFNRI